MLYFNIPVRILYIYLLDCYTGNIRSGEERRCHRNVLLGISGFIMGPYSLRYNFFFIAYAKSYYPGIRFSILHHFRRHPLEQNTLEQFLQCVLKNVLFNIQVKIKYNY